MKTMNKNAEWLYNYLMTREVEEFNMARWWNHKSMGCQTGCVLSDSYEWAHRSRTHGCGTPACLGGTAEWKMMLEAREAGTPITQDIPVEQVGAWLGLKFPVYQVLFYGYPIVDHQSMDLVDRIWGGTRAPLNLRGPKGAQIAAAALKRACEIELSQARQ